MDLECISIIPLAISKEGDIESYFWIVPLAISEEGNIRIYFGTSPECRIEGECWNVISNPSSGICWNICISNIYVSLLIVK